MLDPRIARNNALIARLNKQIADDGIVVEKSKRKPVKLAPRHRSPCICPIKQIGGMNWRMGNPDCLSHGVFNRLEPEKKSNYNLSNHPDAE